MISIILLFQNKRLFLPKCLQNEISFTDTTTTDPEYFNHKSFIAGLSKFSPYKPEQAFINFGKMNWL
jgi:hypothetical protein